jgi:hypothetical protein
MRNYVKVIQVKKHDVTTNQTAVGYGKTYDDAKAVADNQSGSWDPGDTIEEQASPQYIRLDLEYVIAAINGSVATFASSPRADWSHGNGDGTIRNDGKAPEAKPGPKGSLTIPFDVYLAMLVQTLSFEAKFTAMQLVMKYLNQFQSGKKTQDQIVALLAKLPNF